MKKFVCLAICCASFLWLWNQAQPVMNTGRDAVRFIQQMEEIGPQPATLLELVIDTIRQGKRRFAYDPRQMTESLEGVMEQKLAATPYYTFVSSYRYTDYKIKMTVEFEYADLGDISTAQAIKESEGAARQTVKLLELGGKSSIEQLRLLYGYLIRTSAYDRNEPYAPVSYTAYGPLVLGMGVCDGYSSALCMLAQAAGIPMERVTGLADGEPHSWNQLNLDGEIYYFDPTWDDPVPDKQGRVRYDYFCKKKEEMPHEIGQ